MNIHPLKIVLPAVKTLLALLCSLCTGLCTAQQKVIPRDTSFNVHDTWIKEKKLRPYIQIAAPEKPDNIVIKKDIVYRTVNGHALLVDVFYPKKIKKKKPAVLLIFGGGWRSGDKSHNGAMSIELAKNGFVAVSAEYRLSLEAPYPAAVYDLKAAVSWMRENAKQFGIDTSKIASLGCSAGGQLAALLGTTNYNKHFDDPADVPAFSTAVQAVVNIDGTLAFRHPESAEGSAAIQWLGGTYEQRPAIWKEAAPLEQANQQMAPMLFVNSSIPRFHAGRTDIIHKMDSMHIYSAVHTFDDTPHPFWFFHPWFQPMMRYITGFLQAQFISRPQK